MPNDFKRPQPTKSEKMIYELSMQQQQIISALNEINGRLIGLSRAKVTPEVLAEMVLDKEANQLFIKNYNSSQEKIQADRLKAAADQIAPPEGKPDEVAG